MSLSNILIGILMSLSSEFSSDYKAPVCLKPWNNVFLKAHWFERHLEIVSNGMCKWNFQSLFNSKETEKSIEKANNLQTTVGESVLVVDLFHRCLFSCTISFKHSQHLVSDLLTMSLMLFRHLFHTASHFLNHKIAIHLS